MSNEIKDTEDVHSEKETHHPAPEADEQPVPVENGQTEHETTEPSADDEQPATELPLSTSSHPEISEETPSIDQIEEKADEQPSVPVVTEEIESTPEENLPSDEAPPGLPTDDEPTTVLPIDEEPSERNEAPAVVAQPEPANDAPPLLRTIADKPNKEASSAILNTVGHFPATPQSYAAFALSSSSSKAISIWIRTTSFKSQRISPNCLPFSTRCRRRCKPRCSVS